MYTAYEEIKQLTDEAYRSGIIPSESRFLDVLKRHGMSVRGEGNVLLQVTFSVATSQEAIVIGLRYKKCWDPDGLEHTEDHAVFRPGLPIKKCYGNNIVEILAEYKGMHKRQINVQDL